MSFPDHFFAGFPWLSRSVGTLIVMGDSAVLPNFITAPNNHHSSESPTPPKKNDLGIFIYRKNDSAKHVSIAATFQTIHSSPLCFSIILYIDLHSWCFTNYSGKQYLLMIRQISNLQVFGSEGARNSIATWLHTNKVYCHGTCALFVVLMFLMFPNGGEYTCVQPVSNVGWVLCTPYTLIISQGVSVSSRGMKWDQLCYTYNHENWMC